MYAVNKNTFDTQLGATRKTHPNELLNAIKELEKNIKTKIEDSVLLPQSRALEEAIVLAVDKATKGCSKVFNMSGNMCFPNQSIVMLQRISRLQILCR